MARLASPRTPFRSIWKACAGLLFASLALGCQRTSREWNDVFHRSEGWWYSDGGSSAKLPGGKTVWLFGDTWLRHNPNVLPNSMAVQETEPGRAPLRGEIRFFARGGRGELLDVSEVGMHAARSWVEPLAKEGRAPSTWLWPGSALASAGTLIAMYAELSCIAGEMPKCRSYLGNMNVDGYTVVEVENAADDPEQWRIRATPLRDRRGRPPSASRLHWGSALLEEDGWLYIFGVGFGPKWAPEDVKVARVAPRDVARYDLWQFLTPKGWRMVPTGPAPWELESLARGGMTELSVHRVVENGQSWLLMVQVDPLTQEVVVRRSPAGEIDAVRWDGPEAGERVRRFALPVLDPATAGGMNWAGRAHPHQSTPDKGLFLSFFSERVHGLRFLELPMSEVMQ